MLRRMMFSLLLATSITSVQASDIEDKVINGFRFHRTPETGGEYLTNCVNSDNDVIIIRKGLTDGSREERDFI